MTLQSLPTSSEDGTDHLIGIGLYSIPQAARLSRVSASRIRRWIKGYDWSRGDDRHHSPPVWRPDIEPIDGALVLSFRDLVEVRFVDAFLRAGVSWKRLRAIANIASQRFDTTHPFSTRRFLTDGKTIYDEVRREDEDALEDMHDQQFTFRRVISASLHHGLEFAPGGAARRWWPEPGRPASRTIVIDPGRSFGQPIVDALNVPTKVVAAAAAAEAPDGEKKVAEWFGLTVQAVKAAIRFEASLADFSAAA